MACNFVITDPTITISQICHQEIIMFPGLMQNFVHHNVKDQRDMTVRLVKQATDF
jgi:hypothetical protein